MELKTISEIKGMTPSAVSRYMRDIRGNSNEHFNGTEISRLIEYIFHSHSEIPLSDFMFNFLIAYLREAYEDTSWRMRTIEDAAICTDTGMWVFSWVTNGVPHFVLISVEQKDFLETALTALDAGVEIEDIRNINLALLEADTEAMAQYSTLLRILRMIPADPGVQEETIIPELSETLDIAEDTARFSSAMWFEEIQKKSIIIAGLGGIGSYVAFLLARMHPRRMFLYDDDRVEMVNMAGQLYQVHDVGTFKVDAIANMIKDYASYATTFALRQRYTEESDVADIMICGFDNMEARKTFFAKWAAHVATKTEEERKHCLFLDGRLSAEEFQVLCIRGDDEYNISRYSREFLFSDEEADETLCSYKQTTYMANMIGSIIVNLFTNFVANELVENLRDLPFFTSYAADSMMFKVEQ